MACIDAGGHLQGVGFDFQHHEKKKCFERKLPSLSLGHHQDVSAANGT